MGRQFQGPVQNTWSCWTHFHSIRGIQPPNGEPTEAWLPYEVQTALNQGFHSQPLCQLLRRRAQVRVYGEGTFLFSRLQASLACHWVFCLYLFYAPRHHITLSIRCVFFFSSILFYLLTVVLLCPWGIGSRTSHRYRNLRMLKSLSRSFKKIFFI